MNTQKTKIKSSDSNEMAFCFVYFENIVVVTGTIAPSRDIPDLTAEETIRIILSNMNLVVPVVCAIAVIIIAIIVICILRSKGNHHKGIFKTIFLLISNNFFSFSFSFFSILVFNFVGRMLTHSQFPSNFSINLLFGFLSKYYSFISLIFASILKWLGCNNNNQTNQKQIIINYLCYRTCVLSVVLQKSN